MGLIFARPLPAYDEEQRPRLLGPPSFVGPGAPRIDFRVVPEAFRVDEVPLYQPDGEGEHLYLRIEKRGFGTPALVRRVCEAYGVKERDVGVAGRKDARGLTSQWLSVPLKAVPDEGARLAAEDCRVLERGLHPRKLRLGFLRGNRFGVSLAGTSLGAILDEAKGRAATLEQRGCPAYFGAQRFGVRSESLRQAERFVARGRKAKSRTERFWVSAIQSALFNRWLAERIGDGLLHSAVVGDVMALVGSRSNFECEDPDQDTPRVVAAQIVPTGPLHGAGMRPPGGQALTRESRSLEELGVDPVALAAHPAFQIGERRPALFWPSEVVVDGGEGELSLAFTLPKGAYATVLLEETFGSVLVDHAMIPDA